MAKEDIFDLEKEPNLNEIEIRKNLELKRNHFVYGKCLFLMTSISQPEPLWPHVLELPAKVSS